MGIKNIFNMFENSSEEEVFNPKQALVEMKSLLKDLNMPESNYYKKNKKIVSKYNTEYDKLLKKYNNEDVTEEEVLELSKGIEIEHVRKAYYSLPNSVRNEFVNLEEIQEIATDKGKTVVNTFVSNDFLDMDDDSKIIELNKIENAFNANLNPLEKMELEILSPELKSFLPNSLNQFSKNVLKIKYLKLIRNLGNLPKLLLRLELKEDMRSVDDHISKYDGLLEYREEIYKSENSKTRKRV